MSLFAKRLALVTGASRGIGAAMATALAERGCHLLLTARDGQQLEALAETLRRRYETPCQTLVADLTTATGVATVIAATQANAQAQRPVDILVNNAGFGSAGRFETLPLPRETAMVALNVTAPLQLTHALLGGMLERGQGGVITMASVGGHMPMPYMATYGASKAFVLSWSQALWAETRGRGVRVLAVCPGPVPTDFGRAAGLPADAPPNPGAMDAPTVAELALRAYADDEHTVVPGALPWLLTLAARLLPRRWVLAVAARRIGRRALLASPQVPSPPP